MTYGDSVSMPLFKAAIGPCRLSQWGCRNPAPQSIPTRARSYNNYTSNVASSWYLLLRLRLLHGLHNSLGHLGLLHGGLSHLLGSSLVLIELLDRSLDRGCGLDACGLDGCVLAGGNRRRSASLRLLRGRPRLLGGLRLAVLVILVVVRVSAVNLGVL